MLVGTQHTPSQGALLWCSAVLGTWFERQQFRGGAVTWCRQPQNTVALPGLC